MIIVEVISITYDVLHEGHLWILIANLNIIYETRKVGCSTFLRKRLDRFWKFWCQVKADYPLCVLYVLLFHFWLQECQPQNFNLVEKDGRHLWDRKINMFIIQALHSGPCLNSLYSRLFLCATPGGGKRPPPGKSSFLVFKSSFLSFWNEFLHIFNRFFC